MPSNSPPISIIIPVIRPEKAQRCIEAIKANSGLEEWQYEIVAEEDKDRIGCPKMVKRLVEQSIGRIICFLGDDTIPQPGFLRSALDAMDTLPDGWGLIGLSDGTGRDLPTHWLADKRLLPSLDGEFFHTGYRHCFCDNELRDRCREMGRYAMADKALVKHDHALLEGEQLEDPDLNRVYSKEVYNADKKLYYQRRKARFGFKLGIGLPLMTRELYVQFFLSFISMEKPDYTLYVPQYPVGEFPQSIAAARNNLARQALSEACSHLVMMDTDQIYPADTIKRLLSHDKPVVGTPVHRRYPPFDPILYRGDLGYYKHVKDEECYSGDLVSVDATGCGCILYDMRCFWELEPPWFSEATSPQGNNVGEDIHFCSKLRKAGFEIYVDTAIEIGHITLFNVTREMYQLYKKVNKFQYREAD